MAELNPERVRIEHLDSGVADVRLTRAEKHNGLDMEMFRSLTAAVDALSEPAAGGEVRCVVLSGEGPSFCAGLDIKSMAEEGDTAGIMFAREAESPANFAQRVAHGWRELEVPVIAALHGAVLGGGFQIAVAADIRIAAPGTQLSVMEIVHGLIPDMSISQTLPRLVRDDVARELVYTGRKLEAAEALQLGLVTRVADDPVAEALSLAGEIAAKRPEAIRSAKRLLNEIPDLDAPAALALEEELQRALIGALRV